MLADLLQGEDRKVWGYGGYQGQGEVIREAAPHAPDTTSRRTRYKDYVDELQRAKNRVKARVRAKVEHPFRIVKRIFGFERLATAGCGRITSGCASTSHWPNLYLHRKRLALIRA